MYTYIIYIHTKIRYILRGREHYKNHLLKREKQQMSEQKFTFIITYYAAFQKERT